MKEYKVVVSGPGVERQEQVLNHFAAKGYVLVHTQVGYKELDTEFTKFIMERDSDGYSKEA